MIRGYRVDLAPGGGRLRGDCFSRSAYLICACQEEPAAALSKQARAPANAVYVAGLSCFRDTRTAGNGAVALLPSGKTGNPRSGGVGAQAGPAVATQPKATVTIS
jgi:hypothetical protein